MDKLRPCFAALLLLTGCVQFDANGTRHTVVLGFGIVSVPSPSGTNQPAAQVTKTQAIGLVLSDQPGIKAGIGYSSSVVTQIHTNQNVLVEVKTRPGRMKVEASK